MNKKTIYQATGTVFGRLWGGYNSYVKMEAIVANTKAELLQRAIDFFNNTPFRDFEDVKGALLDIECISTIEFEGKEYTNTTDEDSEWIGSLTEEEKDIYYNYLLDNKL